MSHNSVTYYANDKVTCGSDPAKNSMNHGQTYDEQVVRILIELIELNTQLELFIYSIHHAMPTHYMS